MVARICLPSVSLWTALRSGWRSSPHALSFRIDRSRPRTLQQRNDTYGLDIDDKMQTSISWSTSRAVPMSCTALEMRCDAQNDIQMQVGTAADDVSNKEHEVSLRGASDWWRESVRNSVSVHKDKSRGSAIYCESAVVRRGLNRESRFFTISEVSQCGGGSNMA